MIIGFDAKRAFHNNSGLGNYSRTLIKNLHQYFPEHEYMLFTPAYKTNHLHRLVRQSSKIKVITPPEWLPKKLSAVWRTMMMSNSLKSNKVQLYHGLSNELPQQIHKTKIPSLVTIHDLIFLRHPEWYPKIDVLFYKAKFKQACEKADVIVAISEQTKADIIEFYKIKEEKIKVIYQSCDPLFYDLDNMPYRNEVISKYKFDYPFFFYVGSLNERKNVHVLIDAFAHISEKTDHNLVLVGDGSKHYKDSLNEQIIKKGLEHRISMFHKVPNDDLPAIYQLANVFVYPSSYEGFGIPIIEALSSKTPVITSEGSCFKETAGPGAVYTKPGDFKSLGEAMYELSINDAKQKELAENGWQHGQRFHTEKTTKAMNALYKSLIN